MIYYQRSKIGIFYYNDATKELGIVTNSDIHQDIFDNKIEVGVFFDAKNEKTVKIADEPENFFVEYLPRVYGITEKPNTIDNIKSLKKIL